MGLLFKFIPALLFWGVFAGVIFGIPYPESLAQANFKQISLFFVPLFFAISFTFNIFFKNIFQSLSIALGLILLLILKALDSLNLATGILIIISAGLLFSYFKKSKRKNLTKQTKIPKLTHMR
ncbi:hypothetical protein HYU94_00530 [Candidatus Daviesbacteria bacterium]|nr:hypothetical protein [Candidatus Daviesbacteria bacterium]